MAAWMLSGHGWGRLEVVRIGSTTPADRKAVVNVQRHPMIEWRTAALRAALRGKNFSEEAIADGRVINWRWVVRPVDESIAGLFTVTCLVDDEVGAQVRERTVEIDINAEGGLEVETGLGK